MRRGSANERVAISALEEKPTVLVEQSAVDRVMGLTAGPMRVSELRVFVQRPCQTSQTLRPSQG
jgi:hypothetical protein